MLEYMLYYYTYTIRNGYIYNFLKLDANNFRSLARANNEAKRS